MRPARACPTSRWHRRSPTRPRARRGRPTTPARTGTAIPDRHRPPTTAASLAPSEERGRMATTVLPSSRTLARYAVRHGLAAVFLSRAARQGDLVGRLLRDRSVAEEPYDLYEQVRARGRLSSGALGPVTASHAVAQEVLKSEAFGVGWDRSAAPRWVHWMMRHGDELDATGVVDPPSMLVLNPPEHTRFRRLVSRAFTPRAIAAFEPSVAHTAETLLDD